MSKVISFLKSNRTIVALYEFIEEKMFEIATIVSPKLNTILRYKKVFGEYPDFKNPKTFNEKLLYIKLNNYIKNPLVTKCADKYLVREYVKECGFEDILNELLFVYDKPNEIEWDKFPDQFVLKWNFGAGLNIVCADKCTLDHKKMIKLLSAWGKKKYWLPYSEMQYKGIPRKILCEKFLKDSERDTSLVDYKVYCFNGEPRAIFVMHDRGGAVNTEFFDINWNSLQNSKKYDETEVHTARPNCLEQMLECSRTLSNPFPFVRCDFYIVANKLYFGEMTFTPAGGLFTSETMIEGKEMAEYLEIKM